MNSYVAHTHTKHEILTILVKLYFFEVHIILKKCLTILNLVEPLGINILLLKGKYLNLSPYKKKQEARLRGTGTVFLDFWGLKFLYSDMATHKNHKNQLVSSWKVFQDGKESLGMQKRWTDIKQTLYKLGKGCHPILENDPSWHLVSCHMKGTPLQVFIQQSVWK